MARCPFARWRPLPENGSQPRIKPTQAILHSAVDSPRPLTSLYGFFSRTDVTVESHFHILNDGTIEQYMDTTVRADANRDANARAVSIETEDDGDPDNTPWTTAQINSIIRLLHWLRDTHGIPLTTCPAWDKPGLGWHSMWGAPSRWTPARGKTCPGRIRIRQIHDVILPALAFQEIAMPTADGALSDDTLHALTILAYGAFLFRPPEGLSQIAGGTEAMKKEGVASYVAGIANSPEATQKRGDLAKAHGW